jgi:hypothetical protein
VLVASVSRRQRLITIAAGWRRRERKPRPPTAEAQADRLGAKSEESGSSARRRPWPAAPGGLAAPIMKTFSMIIFEAETKVAHSNRCDSV